MWKSENYILRSIQDLLFACFIHKYLSKKEMQFPFQNYFSSTLIYTYIGILFSCKFRVIHMCYNNK